VRPILICSIVLTALGVLAAWWFAGRQLSMFLDRIFTVRMASFPGTPVAYDGDLRIGNLAMTLVGTDNLQSGWKVCPDAQNRVLLKKGGQQFVLGSLTRPPDPAGRPDLDFAPDPGDELILTVDRSAMSWQTFFETNYMTGGPMPTWSRHLYYRLTWKKRSGEKLEMSWRYGQQFYDKDGWTAAAMQYDGRTGLLWVKISAK
jgi:hypothetical protein